MHILLLCISVLASCISAQAMEKELMRQQNKLTQDEGLLLRYAQSHTTLRHIKPLLEKGTNIDVSDAEGMTPLHWAAHRGNEDMVRFFLNQGANKQSYNEQRETPYDIAHHKVRPLLTDEMDLVEPEKNEHNKRKGQSLESSKHKRARIDEAEENSLHQEDSIDSVSETEIQNFDKEFIQAANKCNMKWLHYYIEQGADINLPNGKGNTALHSAARNSRTELVKFLLSKGADIYALNNAFETVFEIASDSVRSILDDEYYRLEQRLDQSRTFIEEEELSQDLAPSASNQDNSEDNGSCIRASEALIGEVSALAEDSVATEALVAMVDIHVSNYMPLQPEALQATGSSIQNDAIKLPFQIINEHLERLNSQKSTKDKVSRRSKPLKPLHRDFFPEVHLPVILPKSFLEKDHRQRTLLHDAPLYAIGFITELIDQGIDLNAQDEKGLTALHCAILDGSLETVGLFLKKGAQVNAKDNEGRTPLMLAAQKSLELALLLLANNAHVNETDNTGKTFREYLPQHLKELF